MWVFYFFAAIVILLGVTSLLGGFRFAGFIRKHLHGAGPEFTPFVSVIAPCRGLEQGLQENIESLFRQDYPAYEIIFVTDQDNDPSLAIVEEVRNIWRDAWYPSIRIVIAHKATDSGQKVHNLRVAAGHVAQNSEVLVFVDTDARPHSHWLRSLVAPLQNERIGAATGYRWFIPAAWGLAAHLRSVWNASIASALGADGHKNFCWGGSTAIRRTTYESLNVSARWRGTVSDDFTLMRTLREAHLPIQFVPECLVASVGDCNLRELFEFTTRQLKITRVYASHFWRSVLLGSLLFVLVFFGGLALVIARAALGFPLVLPAVLLAIIFGLGAAKGLVRLRAVARVLPRHRVDSTANVLAHFFLWPFTAVLYLYNALAAAVSRRIKWRGITYELKSPTETVIIARE